MRLSYLTLLLIASAAGLSAQPAGPTATAVRTAMENAPPKAPNGGTVGTPLERAQEFMTTLRTVCQLVENDGKLFAACDNTTTRARVRGPWYLPQTITEWEKFSASVYNADRTVNGRGRAVVVLNGDKVVAEVSSAGVISLK